MSTPEPSDGRFPPSGARAPRSPRPPCSLTSAPRATSAPVSTAHETPQPRVWGAWAGHRVYQKPLSVKVEPFVPEDMFLLNCKDGRSRWLEVNNLGNSRISLHLMSEQSSCDRLKVTEVVWRSRRSGPRRGDHTHPGLDDVPGGTSQ